MAPSYSAIAARNIHPTDNAHSSTASNSAPDTQPAEQSSKNDSKRLAQRRSPSPSHIPRTALPESDTYVLTLLTDKQHHDRMTALRDKYFPKHLNKLEAHLTLFHALPGSKLDSNIIPVIEDVVKTTRPFQVEAHKPFRLKRGCAISISTAKGGQQGRDVHASLLRPWREAGFLSEQDSGSCRLHYTIMNKVDSDDDVQRVYKELSDSWAPDQGNALGLILWRYEKGYWKKQREFLFAGQ